LVVGNHSNSLPGDSGMVSLAAFLLKEDGDADEKKGSGAQHRDTKGERGERKRSGKGFAIYKEEIQDFCEKVFHHRVFSKYKVVLNCLQLSADCSICQNLALILQLKAFLYPNRMTIFWYPATG